MHNFADFQSIPGDRLLTEKLIIRTYKFLGYTSSDMSYSNPEAQIKCIEETDQKENGTGGYTSIVSGGSDIIMSRFILNHSFREGFLSW